MATADIQVSAKTSQGRTTTKTISDINPNATNEQLATFGTMVNSFTTNVYEGTTKVIKVNVDTESSKPVPTLQIVDGQQQVVTAFTVQKSTSGISAKGLGILQYNGDSQLFVTYQTVVNRLTIGVYDHTTDDIYAFVGADTETGTYNFTLYAPESANYQAASFDFTVTVTD